MFRPHGETLKPPVSSRGPYEVNAGVTANPAQTTTKPPSRLAIFGVLAFFFLAGCGLLAGAAWSYQDEHSGPETMAHVTHCSSSRGSKGNGTDCTATWTVDGQTVTGPLWNGDMSYPGKDVPVRVHGNRAVVPQLWVSIGLAVFGLLILGVAVWLAVRFRRVSVQRRESAHPLHERPNSTSPDA